MGDTPSLPETSCGRASAPLLVSSWNARPCCPPLLRAEQGSRAELLEGLLRMDSWSWEALQDPTGHLVPSIPDGEAESHDRCAPGVNIKAVNGLNHQMLWWCLPRGQTHEDVKKAWFSAANCVHGESALVRIKVPKSREHNVRSQWVGVQLTVASEDFLLPATVLRSILCLTHPHSVSHHCLFRIRLRVNHTYLESQRDFFPVKYK